MQLKLWLASVRTVFTLDGYKPVCGYCDEPIIDAPDMHEVLITRGDIQGNPDLEPVVMVRENCVLVHPKKCHIEAATKEGQKKCIRHLIKYEGKSNLLFWLNTLSVITKSSIANEAYNLVNGENV